MATTGTCTVCGAGLPDASRFCPSCGTPVATSTTTSERKLVSILFADLVGSTAFASDEDPERVRALLDSFYDAMAEEAVAAGGVVEKFAGDAVLAAFGASAAQEDHAERALHAALAMQRRFADLFGEALGLRIGVNTGEVAVGPARVGGSFISGDAVNVAARLEQAAPPGEILASERTVAVVRGAFEFAELETIVAKGKDGGVACRRVIRALSLQRSRGVAGREAPFVGRDGEIDVLRATSRRAIAHGEPHLATIVGEPGVGKTRLTRELWELLAREDPTPVRRIGRCLSYGDGITYWPLAEVLREHLELPEGTSAAKVEERLGEERDLGLVLGLDLTPGRHPHEAREKLHAAFVSFFERLAAEHPAVVVVEDIHWAEEDLLDLLDRIVREARGPLLVLATARPELLVRRPHWGSGQRNTSTIWLEPLRADETGRLVDGLLSQEIPAELRDLLVDRTEGNPFFVEELVGSLLDAGILAQSGGDVQASDLSDLLRVPDSVHAVLAARIDRLPAPGKATLQAASVVGRVFWRDAVAYLLEGEEPDLDVLEERDFARRLSGSAAFEGEYAIKHALTREVAYGSIPKARRGRLHASLAEWLEDRGSSDEHASLLAYHYSEAAKPEDADLVWAREPDQLAEVRRRAVRWLTRAGRLARGRHEILEAVELFTRAVELSDDEHERALLWRAIGEAQALRYDGEAMRSALLRAVDGPLDDEERADAYALLAFQATLRSSMWSIRLNRSLIEEWADSAIALAGPSSAARVRAMLAKANVDPGSTSEEELLEAARLTDQLENLELRSYALNARSVTAFERRQFHEAVEWSDRRLALLDGITDPDHLCEAYESSAPVAAALGRFEEARRLAELHGSLARRLSPHHRVHAVSLELELADALGDWETLAIQTDRVVDAVTANLVTPCVRNPRGLLLCAVGNAFAGDESRAGELEREAERIGGIGYESYLSGPRLRLALLRGDQGGASLLELPVERGFVWGVGALAARLDGLIAYRRYDLVEAEAPIFVQEGTVLEPFALRALGAARRDDELLTRADERFAEIGLEWHRAQTERLLEGL